MPHAALLQVRRALACKCRSPYFRFLARRVLFFFLGLLLKFTKICFRFASLETSLMFEIILPDKLPTKKGKKSASSFRELRIR